MVVQKRFGTVIVYDFRDDYLYYRFRDRSGAHSHNIRYEAISNDQLEFEERNAWFRNVGILWLIIGLVTELPGWLSGNHRLPLWMFLGIGCLGWYYLARTKYTVIPAEGMNLLIIRGRDHDRLKDELFSRRNHYLKEKYGKLNLENDREREIAKFVWLRELEAITQDEFDRVNMALLFGRAEP